MLRNYDQQMIESNELPDAFDDLRELSKKYRKARILIARGALKHARAIGADKAAIEVFERHLIIVESELE